MSGDVNAMRNKASETLIQLYNFADREKRIAEEQSVQAKSVKDYRASERLLNYAYAMEKVRSKVSALARKNFGLDVTV